MVGKTLSLCITTYNRTSMLQECFQQVLDDDRVSEIIVADDGSPDNILRRVERICAHPKVKLFKNQKNLGCYRNKQYVVSLASNDYVIIFDSDNIMTKNYIDKIYEQEWNSDTILAPDFVHSFDYRHLSGVIIDRGNVRKYVDQPRFDCLINTMNYFVNRDNYLKVWDGRIEPWTADTIFQNRNWLVSGFKIHVLKGLEYNHRINHGNIEEKSHYLTHVRKTGNMFDKLMNELRR